MYYKGAYYWVDIQGQSLHELKDGEYRDLKFEMNQVTSVVPYGKHGLLVSLNDKLVLVQDMKFKQEFNTQIKLREKTRFNDAKVDPWGNYWVGSMDLDFESPTGALHCIKPDGEVVCVFDKVTCSNGLAWHESKRKFYYVDSITQEVVAYDFDPVKIKLTNKQIVYRELREQVYPDGMCSDAQGNLWLALYGGAEVLNINPDRAVVEDVLALPCPNVTSCCFAGDSLKQLMVTTASVGTETDNFPEAGYVFKFELNVQGMPVNIFEGNLNGK